jgi:hypothetical protein
MKLNSKCCIYLKYEINKKFIKFQINEFSQKAISIKFNQRNILIQNNQLFKKIPNFKFSENIHKVGSNSDQRYFHEFESPQAQVISTEKLSRRILKYSIIISTILLLIYKFLLNKFNPLSNNFKLFLINDYYDIKLSEKASHKLKKILEHYIYKIDSEEVQTVFKIYKNLAEKNKFPYIPKVNNIYVIHSVSIGAFLFKNGDLFISDRIIELADKNEDQIAFFIAAEMASTMIGNTTKRIFWYYILKNFGNYLKVEPVNAKITHSSFAAYKRDSLNFLNYFLHFYPENIVSTYYEEYEIMRVAFKLLNKSEYDLLEVNYNIMF